MSDDTYTKFVSFDDLKKGIILSIDMEQVLKFAWKTGTNRLYVRALGAPRYASLKIKVA